MSHIISKVRRLYLILHILLFVIFFTLGFVALNGNVQWQLSEYSQQALSPLSKQVVEKVNQPVKVLAFSKSNPELRNAIFQLMSPYLNESEKLSLVFKQPDTELALVKKYDVKKEGTLVFVQENRFSVATQLTESEITKGLQAVQRITPLTIGFAYGHGERYPAHKASFHYSFFGDALRAVGFSVTSFDLFSSPSIPDNIDVLVLADPREAYSDRVKVRIDAFVKKGKNILILAEKESAGHLTKGFTAVDLPVVEGTVSNASGTDFSINDNKISVVKPTLEEEKYPALANLPSVLLFSEATVLLPVNNKGKDESDWQWYSVLHHAEKTLVMRAGSATQNDHEPVIYEASRLLKSDNKSQRQRILLISDADFLSNKFIGNGANQVFGQQLLTFLARPSYELSLEKIASDRYVNLSEQTLKRLTATLLVFIPLGFLLVGLIIGRVYRTQYKDE